MSEHEHVDGSNPDQPYCEVDPITRLYAELMADWGIGPPDPNVTGDFSTLSPEFRQRIEDVLAGNLPPKDDIDRSVERYLATTDFTTDPEYLKFRDFMRRYFDSHNANPPTNDNHSPDDSQ
jgi:hypothetical protein